MYKDQIQLASFIEIEDLFFSDALQLHHDFSSCEFSSYLSCLIFAVPLSLTKNPFQQFWKILNHFIFTHYLCSLSLFFLKLCLS